MRYRMLGLRLRPAAAAVAGIAVFAFAAPAGAALLLVTHNVDGQPGNSNSFNPAYSGDGSYVAFMSAATNLIGGSDGRPHVYRYTVADGSYEMADVQQDTTTSANLPAISCLSGGCVAISNDGRYVAFISDATDLTADPTFTFAQVYVRDLETNTTTLVSQAAGGGGGNGDSGGVLRASSTPIAISGDGRYVTFTSTASDLIPGVGGPDAAQVYVRDMLNGTTALASAAVDGSPANGSAFAGDISDDGRFVVFYSAADNLPLGNGSTGQVYIRDRDADEDGVFDESDTGATTTQTVSALVNPDGATPGNGDSVLPVISGNSSFVAFATQATNLVADDANSTTADVLVWNRSTATSALVDVDSKGVQSSAGVVLAQRPAISDAGDVIAFVSNSPDLVATGDTNGDQADVFVRDLRSATTIIGSADDNGAGGALDSAHATLTGGGDLLGFASSGGSFPPDTINSQIWSQSTSFGGPPPKSADLAVAQIAAPNPVALNGTTTITVTISNLGPDEATNVMLEDTLSFSSVTLTRGTPTLSQGTGCSPNPTDPDMVCSLGTLPAAGSATVTFTVTPTEMPFEGSPFIQNSVEVFSDTADPNGENDRDTLQADVFVAPEATNVAITASAASSEAGAKEVDVDNIPLSAIPHDSGSTASSPIASIPIASIELSGVPIASIPIASIPIASIGFTPSSLAEAFGGVSLAQMPLKLTGGWTTRLAANGISDVPLQSITLAEALTRAPNLLTSPTAITLGDVGIASSPIASIPIASIALGPALLSDLPLLGRTGSGGLDDWCAQLNLAGGSCSGGSSLSGETVMDQTVAGAPIASIPIASIPIASIPIASIPIASIPIASIVLNSAPIASIPIASIVVGSPIASIPIASIPIASIGNVVDCGTYDCTNKTLGQAFADGALKPDATLGDIVDALNGITLGDLASFFPPEITLADVLAALTGSPGQAYERLPFTQMPTQDFATNPATVAYRVDWTLQNGGRLNGVGVAVEMPAGFRYRPGTARLVAVSDGSPPLVVVPDPSIEGQTLTWALPNLLNDQPYRLTFLVSPSLILGPSGNAKATVTPVGGNAVTVQGAGIGVGDTFEPVNDTDSTSPVIKKDTVYLSYFPSGRDRDTYRLPAPPAGSRVTVKMLPPAGVDFDLTIARATRQAVRSAPLFGIPMDGTPLVDNGLPVTHIFEQATPEALQDIPLPGGGVVAAVSDNRGDDEEIGTVITGPDDAGTDLRIFVTPYQSSTLQPVSARMPYTLLVTVTPPPVLPACSPRSYPFAGQGTAGSVPALSAIPTNVNTVFVVNKKRLGDTYGTSAMNSVMTGLQTLAGRSDLGVVGTVLGVDGNAAVATAAAAVNANPCAPELQNTLARSISDVIETVRAARPSLKYVVLVGGDDQIPFFRIDDYVTIENESEYAQTFFDANNQYFGSLFSGKLVTDNPYGTPSPTPFLDRYLYVPSMAVGRLVESPTDILKQLTTFQNFNGSLDPKTALVTGYDFLADGAEDVAATESQKLGANKVTTLISHTGEPQQWTLASLQNALSSPEDIMSVNAHYDHYRALPADQNAALSNPAQLLLSSFLTGKDLARKFAFTVGCHSGYSVSDVVIGGPTDARALDWAQAFNAGGAGYAGQTGFGYGDTVAVAYSERLMALLAKYMDGTMTVGDALLAAKGDYRTKMSIGSPYDEKVLSEATFYGLPMFKVGNVTPPAPPAPLPTAQDPTTGITSASVDVPTNPVQKTSLFGTYWSSGDGTDNVFFRPVQPQTSLDVTQTGLVAHGAAITALESTDVSGFVNGAFSMPTIDLTGRSPEPVFGDVIFPTRMQSIATTPGPNGPRQRLVLVAGRFASDATQPAGVGKQRLFTRIGAKVYYQPAGVTDFTPAQFGMISGTTINGGAAFTVNVTDPGGSVKDVIVGYHDGPVWKFVHLKKSTVNAALWTGGGPNATPGAEFFVEAVDVAGNVANAIFKGRYYNAAVPPPLPPGISVTLTGSLGSNGWYLGDVVATVTGLGEGDGIDLDGGDFDLTSPVTISGEGIHVLGIRHDGTVFPSIVPIDTSAPTVTLATPPATPATYTLGQIVKASFQCDDGGSGVATCVGTVANGANVPTTSIGDKSFTVTATDFAGHSTTVTHTYKVIFAFDGFFQPVDNLPTLNLVSAGASIPVRFSLGGNQGLNIFAAGSPSSIAIKCSNRDPVDPIEETGTANTSSLTYQAGTNLYVYTWATDKKWARTCRQFVMKLVDGTEHRANFEFK